ncbi:MAG: NADH-quinone oxidoreductase subunit NuoE [Candidatus Dormibacteria bacterium]
MTLSAATRQEIVAARERYPSPRSAVLPALWAVQHEVGHLTPEGMAEVADLLRLAPSEVEAVSTFYSMYFDRPVGRHHIIACVNVSCALRGAEAICTHLESRLGVPSGGTSADGSFTWERTVECLGACGGAPAMQMDHHFHENLTPEIVDTIIDNADAGAADATPAATTAPRARGSAAPAKKTKRARPAPNDL